MAGMAINIDQGFNGNFGHALGVPLSYDGTSWTVSIGGFGFRFSGTTEILFDPEG